MYSPVPIPPPYNIAGTLLGTALLVIILVGVQQLWAQAVVDFIRAFAP